MFETTSCQSFTAVAQLGFKHRAKVECNSVSLVQHGSTTTLEAGLRPVLRLIYTGYF